MDIKTIMICLIFVNFSLGIFMLLFIRIQKTYPGFMYWALSNLFVSFSFILFSLRGLIHDFISIIVANSIVFIVGLLRMIGVRKFFGKEKLNASYMTALVMLFLIVFCSFIFFTYADDNINIRVAISTGFTGVISLYLSYLVLKNIPHEGTLAYIITGGIFIVYALFSFSRGYERIILVQSNTIYNATLFNSLFFSFSIIFDVAWTTLFLIINHQRLSNELIAANTELMDLNKIKDRFFAIIAHDLKNPFNGIIGISNLLLENIRNTEAGKVEELIGMIKNTAEQTYSLLGNLLSWAKTQIGAAVFNPGSYNLRDIIEDTIAQVKTTAESKRILIKNRADDAVVVFVDKDMIAAVIRNLLMNAVKFSFPDNEIIIDSREEEHTATLSVRDHGTGISKDDLSKLFKPGEKIVSKGTNNEEGSGIGLLLCKEYVEINAGRIWVESEPGKGSTVNVSLKKIHAREHQSTTSR